MTNEEALKRIDSMMEELKELRTIITGQTASTFVASDKGKKISRMVRITTILQEIGIPAHINGYNYVIDAIDMCVDHPEYIRQVTSILYPEVAKKHDTTGSRVERAIRHGIETAWERRGDVDVLQKYFGNTVNYDKGKPTNSEFVATIANLIRMEEQGM